MLSFYLSDGSTGAVGAPFSSNPQKLNSKYSKLYSLFLKWQIIRLISGSLFVFLVAFSFVFSAPMTSSATLTAMTTTTPLASMAMLAALAALRTLAAYTILTT